MFRIIQDDPAAVQPFGYLLQLPSEAELGGGGVSFWGDLGPIELSGDEPQIGLAKVGRRGLRVERLERHVRTSELLIPADGDIVVAVSPPTSTPLPGGCDTGIRARLGQALLLNPGVWHSPAFPVSGIGTYWVIFRRDTGLDDLLVADLPEPVSLGETISP